MRQYMEDIGLENRCFACMNLTDTPVCSHCGYDNAGNLDIPGQEQFLQPGTVIGGRYQAGIPIDRNGEGITYIAFDSETQLRVRLREFFPGTLCHRDGARRCVLVNDGYEIQFKALMTDFVELSRQLVSIPSNNSLLRAREILADNETIYAVYEDLIGVSLTKYLQQQGGPLSWEETENLFLPLLYTIKQLNSNGIVHRGISPDTILFTSERELRLKGISTSAVRAINTEIKPELFSGYAAPEQYEKCSSHGEWTDVYGICAVLYKALTGVTPPRADMRSVERLVPPRELEPSVPKTVSDAIVKGMEPLRARRTSLIKDLIGDLYAIETVEPTAPAGARRILDEEDDEMEETPRSAKSQPPRHKKHRFRVPIWLIVVVITLPLMLAIFFLAYTYILGPDASRPPEASSDISSNESLPQSSKEPESSLPVSSAESSDDGANKYVVDDFTGKYFEDVVNSEFYQKMFSFKPRAEVYDDNAPIGMIVEQDLEAKTAVAEGSEIGFTVSKGPQHVLIPPFTDTNGNPVALDGYQKYFTDKGIKVTVTQQESFVNKAGEVIGIDRNPGETMDREMTDTLTIYVAKEPAGGYSSEEESSEDLSGLMD